MGRRDTYSEPPRSHRRSRQERVEARKEHKQFQSQSGFDWTPGIVLGLLGAFAFLNHDFDKYKKKHEWLDGDSNDSKSRDGRDSKDSRDSGRGRSRYRSSSRYPDYYDDDEYYRRDRGYSR
ncbi:hypothetical protein LB507_008227 [Fusarium sp. FIESC RH6]|nr:hypothetical protein LB507_008227 [Fusarium sp. FIESC RH6]